jgi:hypothetical protein
MLKTYLPSVAQEVDLESIARQVSMAVDNLLHEGNDLKSPAQLGQERDRLRLLLEVSESIASTWCSTIRRAT